MRPISSIRADRRKTKLLECRPAMRLRTSWPCEERHLGRQLARQPHVVVVEERDEVVGRLEDAAVAGTGKATDASVDDGAQRVVRAEHDVRQLGYAGVEDDDDLDGSRIVLLDDALDRGAHELRSPMGGYHRGDGRKWRRCQVNARRAYGWALVRELHGFPRRLRSVRNVRSIELDVCRVYGK
jgi:hypothetical protein